MKRIVSVVLCLILVFALVPSVFAAGLNDVETQIMTALKEKVTVNGKTAYIPTEYVNQAENFFLSYETTDEQGQYVLERIQEGRDLLAAQTTAFISADGSVNLSALSYDVKSQLLDLAVDACAQVGLKLTWANRVITITDAQDSSVVYFSNSAIIKTTGGFDAMTILPWAAAVVVVAGLVAFAFIYRRKMAA